MVQMYWTLTIIRLSIVQFAKLTGAQICAIDLVEQRLGLAKQLGADKTLNASIGGSNLDLIISQWNKGYVDSVFEAVGVLVFKSKHFLLFSRVEK